MMANMVVSLTGYGKTGQTSLWMSFLDQVSLWAYLCEIMFIKVERPVHPGERHPLSKELWTV